jgi:hypothetical protein
MRNQLGFGVLAGLVFAAPAFATPVALDVTINSEQVCSLVSGNINCTETAVAPTSFDITLNFSPGAGNSSGPTSTVYPTYTLTQASAGETLSPLGANNQSPYYSQLAGLQSQSASLSEIAQLSGSSVYFGFTDGESSSGVISGTTYDQLFEQNNYNFVGNSYSSHTYYDETSLGGSTPLSSASQVAVPSVAQQLFELENGTTKNISFGATDIIQSITGSSVVYTKYDSITYSGSYSVVPLPPSALLFLSGIGGLATIFRRRRV